MSHLKQSSSPGAGSQQLTAQPQESRSALLCWPKLGLGQGHSAALLNASWTSAGLGCFYSSPVARVSRHTWVPTCHPGLCETPRAEGTRHFRDPNLRHPRVGSHWHRPTRAPAWPEQSLSTRRGCSVSPGPYQTVPQLWASMLQPWPYVWVVRDAGGLPVPHLQCSRAAPGQIPISQCFRGTAVTNYSICSREKGKQRVQRRNDCIINNVSNS